MCSSDLFLDTDLIRGGDGGVVSKQGAEGLCLVGAPGIGLAVKTEDGDGAARSGRVATVAALAAVGAAVANAPSLDLHRTVRLPDPRGGEPLATCLSHRNYPLHPLQALLRRRS